MTTPDGSDGPSCCDSLGSRFTSHPRPHWSVGCREKAKHQSRSRCPPALPRASSPRWPHTNSRGAGGGGGEGGAHTGTPLSPSPPSLQQQLLEWQRPRGEPGM